MNKLPLSYHTKKCPTIKQLHALSAIYYELLLRHVSSALEERVSGRREGKKSELGGLTVVFPLVSLLVRPVSLSSVTLSGKEFLRSSCSISGSCCREQPTSSGWVTDDEENLFDDSEDAKLGCEEFPESEDSIFSLGSKAFCSHSHFIEQGVWWPVSSVGVVINDLLDRILLRMVRQRHIASPMMRNKINSNVIKMLSRRTVTLSCMVSFI